MTRRRDPYVVLGQARPADDRPRCGVCGEPSRRPVCSRCHAATRPGSADLERQQLLAQLLAERFPGRGL